MNAPTAGKRIVDRPETVASVAAGCRTWLQSSCDACTSSFSVSSEGSKLSAKGPSNASPTPGLNGQLEKQETGNGTGTGTGTETKICAKLPGQRRLVALGYCLHESQGRVGLRTHGSLTLFMSRTRNNCGGEGTTINSIIVRVKYPFSSHYSQDCTLHAAQDLLNPLPPLDGCQDRIG